MEYDIERFPAKSGRFIGEDGNTHNIVDLLKENGGGGVDGKSAYEIAIDNGFEGTEQQWLDSLKGEPGRNGSDAELQFTQEQVDALLLLIEDDA